MGANRKLAVGITAILAVVPFPALAFTGDVGDVAVVEDLSGAIHANPSFDREALCREAARVFYKTHPDEFDGLVVLTAKQLDFISYIQTGLGVKNTETGFGQPSYDYTSRYGSAGRLQECVRMGDLYHMPDDPDEVGPSTYHIKGIEVLAHEYAHHWLLWVTYDKGDGVKVDRFREEQGIKDHWSYCANSHSVMYGNFITDLGNGSFLMEGGDRKFNTLEQYLMGLRPPEEVEPVWYVDKDQRTDLPLKKGETETTTGNKVEFTVDDVIRAMGQRNPSYPQAQNTWRVGFILVTEAGHEAAPEQIAKVDRYRARWETFFNWATDGNGTMITALGSATVTDAGQNDSGTAVDAGYVSCTSGITANELRSRPCEKNGEQCDAVDSTCGSPGYLPCHCQTNVWICPAVDCIDGGSGVTDTGGSHDAETGDTGMADGSGAADGNTLVDSGANQDVSAGSEPGSDNDAGKPEAGTDVQDGAAGSRKPDVTNSEEAAGCACSALGASSPSGAAFFGVLCILLAAWFWKKRSGVK
ncbi:MAG: hypothetical protein HY897_18290 [Deltaproteobacteria bacterium]|nr:hypothetical protein [Deltaproteobacteria bacterium]